MPRPPYPPCEDKDGTNGCHSDLLRNNFTHCVPSFQKFRDALISQVADFEAEISAFVSAVRNDSILQSPQDMQVNMTSCRQLSEDEPCKVQADIEYAFETEGETKGRTSILELQGAESEWHRLVSGLMQSDMFQSMELHTVSAKVLAYRNVLTNCNNVVHTVKETWRGANLLGQGMDAHTIMPRMSQCPDMDFTAANTIKVGDMIRNSSILQPFMFHPDKSIGVTRALLSGVLLSYDIIWLPLNAFQLEPHFTIVFSAAVFWSVDMILSFMQGIHDRGIIDMRPGKVARNYLLTWFIIDMVMLVLDWTYVTILMKEQADAGGNNGLLRVGRSYRAVKFLRAMRLLRLVRTTQAVIKVLDGFASEMTIVISKLGTLIVGILVLNHYIACGWFALGFYNDDDAETWIHHINAEGDQRSTLYLICLHWSLTQFTPATNNVSPTNARERGFAIFVVLFALVMFSNFLSCLSNATARIRQLNQDRYGEEAAIREFLTRKCVPLPLGNRIWRYFHKHYNSRKVFVQETDVPFFSDMPPSLTHALHAEIYFPVLTSHPLFKLSVQLDSTTVLQVCKHAIRECSYHLAHEIFLEGDAAEDMFFLAEGRLSYECVLYEDMMFLDSPFWIAEPALWSDWRHCGILTVESACDIVVVNCARFEKIMLHLSVDSGMLKVYRYYAILFTEQVADLAETCSPITDIPGAGMDCLEVAQRLTERAAGIRLGLRAHQKSSMKAVATDRSLSWKEWIVKQLRECCQCCRRRGIQRNNIARALHFENFNLSTFLKDATGSKVQMSRTTTSLGK